MRCRPTLFSMARLFWHGGEDDVSSRQSQKEGRQGAPLLERGGEPARGSGPVVQRQVLYLGEINDSQQAAWRKTLEVFDEAEQQARA